MGWFSKLVSKATDDILGFDPPKAGVAPAATPTVTTIAPEEPAQGGEPALTSYDQVQAYLQIQRQKAMHDLIMQGYTEPAWEEKGYDPSKQIPAGYSMGLAVFVGLIVLLIARK